jgi:general secretion pathway protein G
MIRACSIDPPRRRRLPAGFTMIELLVVILILAILIALLLPAINGALRSARNSAVGGEINQLAQALASFKAKYGEYPPSRVLLIESGNYTNFVGSNFQLGPGDITVGQLAQRSLASLRKFFPNVVFSTSGPIGTIGLANFYDFNGDNIPGAPNNPNAAYILQGHECLVFFLGGIPFQDSSGTFSMAGFAKDPRNPFRNNIPLLPNGNPNPMYSNNRQPPLFEFNSVRLIPDGYIPYPANIVNQLGLVAPGIPGYLDSLGNRAPVGVPGDPINFFAYFSSYGNGGYDPNDVNFSEFDIHGTIPALKFWVNFPVPGGCASAPPNPYTSSFSVPPNGSATYQSPQTFQIISSGADGLYGVGGRYATDTADPLVLDTNTPSPYLTTDTTIRTRERDNITNFHNGRLD